MFIKIAYYLILLKFFKKKKQYQTYSNSLKLKSEIINSKIKELQLKEKNVGQTISIQAYNKLKAHLNILLKKHQAFKDMVINSGENFLVGQLSNPQIDNKTTKNKTFNIITNEYDMAQSIESIFKKEPSDLNTNVKKIVCENYFLTYFA